MVNLLVSLIVLLLLVLFLLARAIHRISSNAAPRTLEEHARATNIVYVPISRALLPELKTWSKPLRLRIEARDDVPVAELILTTDLEDKA